MLENRSFTAWLRRLFVSLFALLEILALSACGGGSGAPINVLNQPPPVVVPLAAFPAEPTIYAKVPSSLTVSGGNPPYRAFSSNTLVLPVVQNIPGATLGLLASPLVTASTNVTLTIQDSSGASLQVPVIVLPELVTPPPALVVLPEELDAYPNVPTQLVISGGVAPFRAFSSNPTVLPVTLSVPGSTVPCSVPPSLRIPKSL